MTAAKENVEQRLAISFTVEIDQAKNLLVIRYRRRVTASAVEQCAEEVRAAASENAM